MEQQKPISSLNAKNLMALGVKGSTKAADLQGIIEEGADGRPDSEQIYIDPEDPKKKKYDELKKKAHLLAQRKEKKRARTNGEEVSDTTSMKSSVSKVTSSQMSVGSVGTTSSVAGPFLTHARAPRSQAPPYMRH